MSWWRRLSGKDEAEAAGLLAALHQDLEQARLRVAALKAECLHGKKREDQLVAALRQIEARYPYMSPIVQRAINASRR